MLAANRAPDEWIGVSNDCQRAGIAKSNVPTEHWLTSPSLKDKTRSRNIEQWKVRTATPAEKDVDMQNMFEANLGIALKKMSFQKGKQKSKLKHVLNPKHVPK